MLEIKELKNHWSPDIKCFNQILQRIRMVKGNHLNTIPRVIMKFLWAKVAPEWGLCRLDWPFSFHAANMHFTVISIQLKCFLVFFRLQTAKKDCHNNWKDPKMGYQIQQLNSGISIVEPIAAFLFQTLIQCLSYHIQVVYTCAIQCRTRALILFGGTK